jgi:hypothetical protein
VVFRRYTFRLSVELVSLALHSVLGGSPTGFHVVEESNRHFRFSVATKKVGFMVLALKRIISANFDVYFDLWGNGSPNWRKEYALWCREEDEKWTVVRRRSSRSSKLVSFGKNLVQDSPNKKHSPSGHFNKGFLRSAMKRKSKLIPHDTPTVQYQKDFVQIGSFKCPLQILNSYFKFRFSLKNRSLVSALVLVPAIFSRISPDLDRVESLGAL